MKTLFKKLCSKPLLSQSQAALLNFLAISLMKDEDADVRSLVAYRIDPDFLPEMMKDENSSVRHWVAYRIDSKFLPEMMKDENWNVRYWVAERIDPKFLPEMMNDENEIVRWRVVQRMKNLRENRVLRKIIIDFMS